MNDELSKDAIDTLKEMQEDSRKRIVVTKTDTPSGNTNLRYELVGQENRDRIAISLAILNELKSLLNKSERGPQQDSYELSEVGREFPTSTKDGFLES